MPRIPLPKGINEKISLDEPDVWNVDDFEGHERMAVSRGNTALRNVFENTRTKLPKLLATVRWSVLRRPYKDYAVEAGMSANGYMPLEKDPKGPSGSHRDKITRLLGHWTAQGISTGVREQLLDLLINPDFLELDPGCTDLLSSIEYMREQSLQLIGSKEMSAFYHRVGYELGHTEVEKKFPSIYNTLWQRERTGTIPDFSEVLNFVETMYAGRSDAKVSMRAYRQSQAEAVWEQARRNQYLERTLEAPLAELLTRMEMHLGREYGETLTAKSILERFNAGSLNAEKLIQSELIDTVDVELIARRVMNRKRTDEFLGEWDGAYAAEAERLSFGRLCQDAMNARGLTAADVGRALDVKPPEERGLETAGRKQRYRPDAEIRGVMFQNRVSSQVPVEALIQVIAKDEAQASALRDAYFAERERFFRRNGYRKQGDGLRMRIQRELAGTSMTTLAKTFLPKKVHDDASVVRQKDLELQRLERQEGKKKPSVRFRQVFPVLEKLAVEQSEQALDRLSGMDEMPEELKKFASVTEMARNLVKGMKGADALSEAMRNIAQRDSQWLRSDLITKMSQGDFVSALPSLRLMVKASIDRALPDEVLRDWYERFPKQLEAGILHFGKVTHPTAKALCTIIATREANPMDFFEHRVPGVVPTQGTKVLRELNYGTEVDWRQIHKYLLAAGIKASDSTYQYLKLLHESGGDVTATLKQIVPALRESGKEVHPVNLPGLIPSQLKAKWIRQAE